MDRTAWLSFVCLLAIATLVLFANLGDARLFDDDEGKNATCGREMFERGDWLVPTFNHDLRTDKPILIYWFMLVAYHLFGVSEFAARFCSASAGVGTVLLTFGLAQRLFRPAVGFWAGLMLATCLMFDVSARAATPDSLLIFFTTLAMWLFVRCVPNAIPANSLAVDAETKAARLLADARWFHFVPTYAAMGLAVLAKGPVGVVLPTAALVLYALLGTAEFRDAGPPAANWREVFRRVLAQLATLFSPRKVARAIWQLRPLVAIAVVGGIALPWYIAVGIETDGAWLAGFLGKHNLERFLEPMEGHRGPIFYYVIAVIIGFFPWSIFLPLSLMELGHVLRHGAQRHFGLLFVACWAGFYIGFFSLAGTKLPSYVLPAYPALAVIVAAFVDAWLREPARFRGIRLRLALGSVPVVGIGIVIALPIVAHFILPGEGWLGLLGLVLVGGGSYAYWQSAAGNEPRAARALAVTAVLFSVGMFGFAAPRVATFQNSARVVAAARQNSADELRLVTFDYFVPSLAYYAQERVERLTSADDAANYLREHPDAFLVTRDAHLDELHQLLPSDVTTLARQRRFLRSGDVVLLGRPPQTAALPGATKSD